MRAKNLPASVLFAAFGLPNVETEYQFALPRQFAFDFAWPVAKVALEQEGGIYGRGKKCPLCGRRSVGAHTSIERLKSDMTKYNLAAALNWVVFRATPEQLQAGEVLSLVKQALEARDGLL